MFSKASRQLCSSKPTPCLPMHETRGGSVKLPVEDLLDDGELVCEAGVAKAWNADNGGPFPAVTSTLSAREAKRRLGKVTSRPIQSFEKPKNLACMAFSPCTGLSSPARLG